MLTFCFKWFFFKCYPSYLYKHTFSPSLRWFYLLVYPSLNFASSCFSLPSDGNTRCEPSCLSVAVLVLFFPDRVSLCSPRWTWTRGNSPVTHKYWGYRCELPHLAVCCLFLLPYRLFFTSLASVNSPDRRVDFIGSLPPFQNTKLNSLFILSHLEATDTVNNIPQSVMRSIADSHWSRTTLLWCPFMFLWIDELTTWQMLSFLFYCWEKNEAPGARTRTGHGPCSLTPEVGSAIPDPGGSSGQQLTTR